MDETNNLNIILVGMPGGGKSFIGEKLSKLLAHFTYLDTDTLIEEKTGRTISEIFEKHGEKYFRELETTVIKKLTQKRNQIISIGGGSFESEQNRDSLKRNSLSFYLKTPAKELFERIQKETHRPLFKDDLTLKTVEDLLRKREKNYYKADFIINTYQTPAYAILDNILREYEEYVKQRTFC